MLFQDRQSMQRDLCHTPKISRNLLQSEDLVRGAATRTKTALTIFQFWSLKRLLWQMYMFWCVSPDKFLLASIYFVVSKLLPEVQQ